MPLLVTHLSLPGASCGGWLSFLLCGPREALSRYNIVFIETKFSCAGSLLGPCSCVQVRGFLYEGLWGVSLGADGTPIRQLPDLVRAGQVGGFPRDPGAGDDRDGGDPGTC